MNSLRVSQLLFLIVVFTLSAFGQVSTTGTTRNKISINAGWRFWKGDLAEAAGPSFNDRNWQTVSLPHTWNASDPFDDEPGYYRGPGWYRRMLQITPSLRGKRLFLFF